MLDGALMRGGGDMEVDRESEAVPLASFSVGTAEHKLSHLSVVLRGLLVEGG